MEKFIEIMKTDPDSLFDWIANNGHELSKTDLIYICRELIYALSYVKEQHGLAKYEMESIYQCIVENMGFEWERWD